jgi:hypothetical protein
VSQRISQSKVTLRHHIRPVVGQDLEPPVAAEKHRSTAASALHAVLMAVLVLSLMISVSCLLRVFLYVTIRKLI